MANLSQQQIDFRNAMAKLPGAVNITTKHTILAAQAEVAEQDKGARFNRNQRHDVRSFIKLSYKHLFSKSSLKGICSKTTTLIQSAYSEWWKVGAISRIGHRYGPHKRPFLH